MDNDDALITARYKALEGVLDERQRRLYAAAEAKVLGHGGAKRVWHATGVARGSILAGLKELAQVLLEPQGSANETRRIRRPGAGRKKLLAQDPAIGVALERLVEPTTVGDPETPLRWTCKSLMHLSRELQAQGYTISHVTVGALLKEMGAMACKATARRWKARAIQTAMRNLNSSMRKQRRPYAQDNP
jgi:hypothetical protein